jgi:hypothetical protein
MAGQLRFQILGCILVASLASGADDRSASAPLEVNIGTGKRVGLSAKEWAKLPRKKVDVKGKGVYEGVDVAEVLRFAGASFEKHPRERAAAYVLVEGSDGYRAVLALAEVDPKVTDKTVLLADRLDGKTAPTAWSCQGTSSRSAGSSRSAA